MGFSSKERTESEWLLSLFLVVIVRSNACAILCRLLLVVVVVRHGEWEEIGGELQICERNWLHQCTAAVVVVGAA